MKGRPLGGSGLDLHDLRVLIVDDNATNREILHHQVTAWGMQPRCVASGPEALTLLHAAATRGDPYDLAILDMQMPEMDGLELARTVRGDITLASVRLVMLTSPGVYGDVEAVRQAGITGFVSKPVRRSQLYNCLVTAMSCGGVSSVPRPRITLARGHSMQPVNPEVNHRILIIDDNPAIHNDIKRILQEDEASGLDDAAAALFGEPERAAVTLCYDIDSAYQGQEGLENVITAQRDQRPYAMAFVDMRMPPGWDGLQTIEKLWQEEPDLQVVICTAYSDYSWSEMVARLGQTDRLLILKKPFDIAEVRQIASALTSKWNLTLQLQDQLATLDAAVAERTREIEAQQQELATTHAQLLHAQKMESIGQLAAGIAHEINTPTQYVNDNTSFLKRAFEGMVEALQCSQRLLQGAQEGAVEADVVSQTQSAFKKAKVAFLLTQVPRALDQSLEGLARVANIVGAMKEFSHPSQGQKQPVDLAHAMETTITVAGNEWKYVAEMVTDFDPAMPPVPCLRDEFNQVILNLIVNASHAISDVMDSGQAGKGTITLSTKVIDDWAEIRLSDTGGGIPADIQQKIFDPFFTTKEVGKGTGQGLAIARSVVVDKHGGKLEVESEIGMGTTFIIRLPIHDSVAQAVGEGV